MRKRHGFTLVELLVVIGIIAILVGLLMPAFAKARMQANSVACQSNLRQIGMFLQGYLNDNKGWIFPVGPDETDAQGNLRPGTYGTQYPPHLRWPMRVPGMVPHPPDPYPYDVNQPYVYDATNPDKWQTAPFTPPIMLCPSDLEPALAHSYLLNHHLAYQRIRSGTKRLGGLTASDVIVMGEKITTSPDYYMERDRNTGDFDIKVEQFRHGVKLGSNYLKFDWHVDTLPPREALTGVDPWAPRNPELDPNGNPIPPTP
jgi:prepilin-type N-terminal cleavage/methylation domain-containing protein